MDNRVVSVISSKKRRKKKKPRPEVLPKLPEIPAVSTSTSSNDSASNDTPNSSGHSIPQVTITPPKDDGVPCNEVYPPPDVYILSQSSSSSSSSKRKKKRKKPPALSAKDEVRPSVGYTPRSLCKSVHVQPTVSELEEVNEDAENQAQSEETLSKPTTSKFSHDTVPELLEEEVSVDCVDSAYSSAESGISNGILSHCLAELPEDNKGVQTTSTCSSVYSVFNCIKYEQPQEKEKLVNTSLLTERVFANCDTIEQCYSADAPSDNGELHCPENAKEDLVLEDTFTTLQEKGVQEDVSTQVNQPAVFQSQFAHHCSSSIETENDISVETEFSQECSKSRTEVGDSLDSDLKSSSCVSENVTVLSELAETAESVSAMPSSCEVGPKAKRAGKGKKVDDKSAVKAQVNAQSDANQNVSGNATEKEATASGAKVVESGKTAAQLKAERKAAFEAQKGAQLAAQKAQSAQKSKADIRAERRAVQEAQRAAKDDTTKKDSSKETSQGAPNETSKLTLKDPPSVSRQKTATTVITDLPLKKSPKPVQEKEPTAQRVHLFSHLPQFQWNSNITSKQGLSGNSVHPAVIQAGLRMAKGLVSGSDARCVATLAAFRQVIKDYSTPPQKELSRDLDSKVEQYTKFLEKCRPLSVSMTNAIKDLRFQINQIPSTTSDAEATAQLCGFIDDFVNEEIILSKEQIADFVIAKIHKNDVILIYGCSPLVKQVLTRAKKKKITFKVVVVDARPGLDGREMVHYLVENKIECSYILINAVSYVMKQVNLVLLDCHSLHANGYVTSRVGSSQIALVAQASNVPVLVCCETYKFCNEVCIDSFVHNELGNPEDLVTTLPAHKLFLKNWKELPNLNLVNITYDVMPADLVTAIVTELCTLPCTSVPVVLRVKPKNTLKRDTQK